MATELEKLKAEQHNLAKVSAERDQLLNQMGSLNAELAAMKNNQQNLLGEIENLKGLLSSRESQVDQASNQMINVSQLSFLTLDF